MCNIAFRFPPYCFTQKSRLARSGTGYWTKWRNFKSIYKNHFDDRTNDSGKHSAHFFYFNSWEVRSRCLVLFPKIFIIPIFRVPLWTVFIIFALKLLSVQMSDHEGPGTIFNVWHNECPWVTTVDLVIWHDRRCLISCRGGLDLSPDGSQIFSVFFCCGNCY